MITIHPKDITSITLKKGSLKGIVQEVEEPKKSKFLKWFDSLFNKKVIQEEFSSYEIREDGCYYSESKISITTSITYTKGDPSHFITISDYYTTLKEAQKEFDRLTKQFNEYHNLNK